MSLLVAGDAAKCVNFLEYNDNNDCSGTVSSLAFTVPDGGATGCTTSKFPTQAGFDGSIGEQICNDDGTFTQLVYPESKDCTGTEETLVFTADTCLYGYKLEANCGACPESSAPDGGIRSGLAIFAPLILFCWMALSTP